MNLLLLEQSDFTSANRARVTDRRLQHLLEVHRASPGDVLKTGLINGNLGTAKLLDINADTAELEVNLNQQPPAPLPVTLILALPRPKMLKRTLQTIATMGVKTLYLINSYRVEKSYWQSPGLDAQAIREQLILGLEQGGDTQLPEVFLKKRFKPFVEDELGGIVSHTTALLAHPYTATTCPVSLNRPTTLAVGPEGGFIPYEVDMLQAAGFQAVTLGERILRVETAIPSLLARLFTN